MSLTIVIDCRYPMAQRILAAFQRKRSPKPYLTLLAESIKTAIAWICCTSPSNGYYFSFETMQYGAIHLKNIKNVIKFYLKILENVIC